MPNTEPRVPRRKVETFMTYDMANRSVALIVYASPDGSHTIATAARNQPVRWATGEERARLSGLGPCDDLYMIEAGNTPLIRRSSTVAFFNLPPLTDEEEDD